MAIAKTTSLTFRTATDGLYRSIANMIQVMILDFCERVGVTIFEQGIPSQVSKKVRSA